MYARDARGCKCDVVYGVPAARTVHALCVVVYLRLELYGCLRHVALTTGVYGEIRLISVSSRLANAKPLSSSLLVCVDDVRDWTVVARGFPLALGHFVSPLRRLALLRYSAPRRSLSLCLETSYSPTFLT